MHSPTVADCLLDTHTLLWFLTDAPELPAAVRETIVAPENTISVSVASLWEIAIKSALGKLPLASPILEMARLIEAQDIALLPISVPAIDLVSRMPMHHRDPFDRLLAAAALTSGLTLLSADTALDPYGVTRIWA